MQISRLFDKYWIHENFSDTQPHSYMMLVKTLGKLIEHVIQHPFAP
jgi:ribosomal protein S15P/S13E